MKSCASIQGNINIVPSYLYEKYFIDKMKSCTLNFTLCFPKLRKQALDSLIEQEHTAKKKKKKILKLTCHLQGEV
ncbi:hypothetical protein PanWU01x14_141200 [Parasponia andersonii]|uniref:Uncharacterized protein n=1 Tax=Parasponia andersonii TaxID=3476 RepID=A0A2P5CLI9_PARAD|nr:hypothetical protein PanWU01x14_141200 [Parasponia andersonii]